MSHFKDVCSCGITINQCRCPDPHKEVRVSPEPCTHIVAKEIPPPPVPHEKDLGREHFKHIDEAIAKYHIACSEHKELYEKYVALDLEVKNTFEHYEKLKSAKATLELAVQKKKSEATTLGNKLLKEAGV